MLIAERLLLIACEPLTGETLWPRAQPSPSLVVAGAVASELLTQGRLALRNGVFRADTRIPTGHPLLNTALNSIGHQDVDAASLLRAIAHRMDPIVTRILDGLYRRDILHRVSQRNWLLRRKLFYPVRSMQARNEAVDALRTASHNAELNGLAFLFLADVSGLLAASLRAQDHAPAEQRILALNHVTSESSEPMRGLAHIRFALLS